jgi:hypothetical protein
MRTLALVCLSLVSFAACVVELDRDDGSDPAIAANVPSGLTITSRTDTDFAGTFAGNGSVIRFDAVSLDGAQAQLHLDVNDFAFDVDFDSAAGMVALDGHHDAIFAADRAIVIDFQAALAPVVDPAQGPLQEVLVARAAIQLSDTPVGLALPPTVVEPTPDSLAASSEPTGCYSRDDDGVAYLPSCNAMVWAKHDADAGGHCMIRQQVFAGPASAGCMGRCGSGCGYPSYTQDCVDHDQCCAEHGGCWNPWHPDCGDEYFEALDDYWFAWVPNCW